MRGYPLYRAFCFFMLFHFCALFVHYWIFFGYACWAFCSFSGGEFIRFSNVCAAASSASRKAWTYLFVVDSCVCPRREATVFMSAPLDNRIVAEVCPYSIITLNSKTLIYQGVAGLALFFSTLFPNKNGV